MSAETIALIALAITIIGNLAVLGEKLFGGGNKLANKFAALELKHVSDIALIEATHTKELSTLRNEFMGRCELSDSNTRMGITTITNNIHLLEKGLLEFRAMMGENYMRRDSFYKAADEIKTNFKELNNATRDEMKSGFERVEKTLDELGQSIEANRKARNASHA